jgi:hypothetical protein
VKKPTLTKEILPIERRVGSQREVFIKGYLELTKKYKVNISLMTFLKEECTC